MSNCRNSNNEKEWVNFYSVSPKDLNKIYRIRFNNKEAAITKPIQILGYMLFELYNIKEASFSNICQKCEVNSSKEGGSFPFAPGLYLKPCLKRTEIRNFIFLIIEETALVYSLQVLLKNKPSKKDDHYLF
jgi:hypothetical protein